MIDLPPAAPAIFVNVQRAPLHAGNRRRWQIDFVFHRLTVIRKLKLRMIDAVEFPEHPDEIGLAAKHLTDNDTRAVAQRLPSKVLAGEDALSLHKFLIKLRQRQFSW